MIACLNEMLTTLYTCLAIVAYLRKSKTGNKKSLLGDSNESEEKTPTKVLNPFLYSWDSMNLKFLVLVISRNNKIPYLISAGEQRIRRQRGGSSRIYFLLETKCDNKSRWWLHTVCIRSMYTVSSVLYFELFFLFSKVNSIGMITTFYLLFEKNHEVLVINFLVKEIYRFTNVHSFNNGIIRWHGSV
jgi:hypothetical protein